jgi:hypothetical protein
MQSLLLHYDQTCFGTGREISSINLACQDWSKVLYVGGIQELWCATCLSCMTERTNKLDFFAPIALICGASCQRSLQLCQLHHQTTNQAHQTLQTVLQVSHLMKWLHLPLLSKFHHHQQHLQQASVSPYNFLNMIIFIDIPGQVMCSWMRQWPLCLRCRWLLVQRQAKSNEAYPHKCVAAWMRILSSASQHDDWVFPLLPEMQQKLRHNFLITIYLKFLADYDVYIYMHHWELMKSVVVMAACLCYWWWWWRSDTLWATLIWLWLHSSSCCLKVMF